MIELIKEKLKEEIKILNSILGNINIKEVKMLEINCQKDEVLDLNLPKNKSFIYIIKSVNSMNCEDISACIETIKHKYAMSRINKDNFKVNRENCLYVGSSHNIVKRVKEHLGTEGSDKTYAMHLKKWWKNGPIVIKIYSVEGSDKYLQLFEDILWDHYKPILGRQGKNSWNTEQNNSLVLNFSFASIVF